MHAERLIESLAAEGPLLADSARDAGLDTAVPGLDWDVRTLVTHVGGVHRWAADIVRTAAPSLGTDAHSEVGTGPDDATLLEWFADGHAGLVEALRQAPPDLPAATFLPAESPRHFWARRQAHETAIHRADAERAAGRPTYFAADFAQDGIAELLDGFAARRSNAVADSGSVGLDAADGPSWLITFGGERITAGPAEDLVDTDATVRGLSSDLYLWLWNRACDAVVDGDAEVAGRWAHKVRVKWR